MILGRGRISAFSGEPGRGLLLSEPFPLFQRSLRFCQPSPRAEASSASPPRCGSRQSKTSRWIVAF